MAAAVPVPPGVHGPAAPAAPAAGGSPATPRLRNVELDYCM